MGFPISHLIKQRVAASVKQAATLFYFFSIFSNITRLFGVHNLCDSFHEKRNANSSIYLSNFSFSKASANAVSIGSSLF